MASGKDVLAAIQARRKEYDGTIATRSSALQGKREQAAELRQSERGLIERIAQQRLAAAGAKEMLQALGETDREVARLVAERGRQQETLRQQLQQAQAEQQQRSEAHDNAAQQHELAVTTAGEAVEAVLQAIRATPAQQALLDAEEQAEAQREAALAELQRCDGLLQACTQQMQSDPLSAYLLRRDYGSVDYTARGPVAMLDRWVAGVCGFGSARLRQALAEAQQARAQRAADSAEQALDEAVSAREAPEIAAIEASPAQALLQAEAEASQRRADRLAALSQAEARVAVIETSLDAIDRNADSHSQQALEALIARLHASDDNLLHRAVADTRGTEDDRLAIELSQCRSALQALATEMETLSGEIEQLRTELVTLNAVAREFPARGLSDTYSVFTSTRTVLELLGQLQSGSLASDRFWQSVTAQHQIRRPPPSRPSSSSSSSWRPSSSRSSGSGFGGSGFRSGGGFKGGGFRSGKGF